MAEQNGKSDKGKQQEQPFDYYVVLDFEACWDERGPKHPEIIEFPSCLYSVEQKKQTSEVQVYVKPTLLKVLHPETTRITGITQQMVDEGSTFKEALARHQQWMRECGLIDCEGEPLVRFAFVTCGDWDLGKMLPLQCNRENLPLPETYKRGFVNIKKHFSVYYGARMKGMDGMLRELNIELLGRHHSGIDDCRNITRILHRMIEDGAVLDITGDTFEPHKIRLDERNPNKARKESIPRKSNNAAHRGSSSGRGGMN